MKKNRRALYLPLQQLQQQQQQASIATTTMLFCWTKKEEQKEEDCIGTGMGGTTRCGNVPLIMLWRLGQQGIGVG